MEREKERERERKAILMSTTTDPLNSACEEKRNVDQHSDNVDEDNDALAYLQSSLGPARITVLTPPLGAICICFLKLFPCDPRLHLM